MAGFSLLFFSPADVCVCVRMRVWVTSSLGVRSYRVLSLSSERVLLSALSVLFLVNTCCTGCHTFGVMVS